MPSPTFLKTVELFENPFFIFKISLGSLPVSNLLWCPCNCNNHLFFSVKSTSGESTIFNKLFEPFSAMILDGFGYIKSSKQSLGRSGLYS